MNPLRRVIACLAAAVLSLTLAGCGDDPTPTTASDGASSNSGAETTGGSPTDAEPDALTGTWTRELTDTEFVALLVEYGARPRAAREYTASAEFPSPRWEMLFAEGQWVFRNAAAPDPWIAGTYTVDGDMLSLFDEAGGPPVLIRHTLSGPTLALEPAEELDPTEEFRPGLPIEALGAAFLAHDDWTRAA